MRFVPRALDLVVRRAAKGLASLILTVRAVGVEELPEVVRRR